MNQWNSKFNVYPSLLPQNISITVMVHMAVPAFPSGVLLNEDPETIWEEKIVLRHHPQKGLIPHPKIPKSYVLNYLHPLFCVISYVWHFRKEFCLGKSLHELSEAYFSFYILAQNPAWPLIHCNINFPLNVMSKNFILSKPRPPTFYSHYSQLALLILNWVVWYLVVCSNVPLLDDCLCIYSF